MALEMMVVVVMMIMMMSIMSSTFVQTFMVPMVSLSTKSGYIFVLTPDG